MIEVPPPPEDAIEVITRFLSDYLEQAGSRGFVVPVSGGLDSTVVLELALRAVGERKVLALYMPEEEPKDDRNFELLRGLAERRGFSLIAWPIGPLAFHFSHLGSKKVVLGNVKARLRMVVAYSVANDLGLLVLGASNKSEIMLGYFTKYGDGAADLYPIKDLYKTQVVALAGELGIPEEVLEKKPSAGLWEGQTDEEELGAPYSEIDPILYGLELGLSEEEIVERGHDPALVKGIIERVRRTRHKRIPFPGPKLSLRTPGLDWWE